MNQKVKVSIRALEGRIKRALKKEDKILKKCRLDSHSYLSLGNYYIVTNDNWLLEAHCNLKELAKELKVLKPGEEPTSPPK